MIGEQFTDPTLFGAGPLEDHLASCRGQLDAAVRAVPEAELSHSLHLVAERLLTELLVEPPVLDLADVTSPGIEIDVDPDVVVEPGARCQRMTVVVGVSGAAELLRLNPGNVTDRKPDGWVGEGTVSITLSAPEIEADAAGAQIDAWISDLRIWMVRVAALVAEHNALVRAELTPALEARAERFRRARIVEAELGIPIKARPRPPVPAP